MDPKFGDHFKKMPTELNIIFNDNKKYYLELLQHISHAPVPHGPLGVEVLLLFLRRRTLILG